MTYVYIRQHCYEQLLVMVYNTTDNITSMDITDLISDGEYSVTVVGRDGAGRLGQKSKILNISSNDCSVISCPGQPTSIVVLQIN